MLVTSWKPPPSLGQPFLRLTSPLSRGGSLAYTPLFLGSDPVPPPPDLVLTYPAWRGFPGGSLVKKLPVMQEMCVRSPGQSRSPGKGNGQPLQYSCLGNPTDRGARRAKVHGGTKVRHGWATHTVTSTVTQIAVGAGQREGWVGWVPWMGQRWDLNLSPRPTQVSLLIDLKNINFKLILFFSSTMNQSKKVPSV